MFASLTRSPSARPESAPDADRFTGAPALGDGMTSVPTAKTSRGKQTAVAPRGKGSKSPFVGPMRGKGFKRPSAPGKQRMPSAGSISKTRRLGQRPGQHSSSPKRGAAPRPCKHDAAEGRLEQRPAPKALVDDTVAYRLWQSTTVDFSGFLKRHLFRSGWGERVPSTNVRSEIMAMLECEMYGNFPDDAVGDLCEVAKVLMKDIIDGLLAHVPRGKDLDLTDAMLANYLRDAPRFTALVRNLMLSEAPKPVLTARQFRVRRHIDEDDGRDDKETAEARDTDAIVKRTRSVRFAVASDKDGCVVPSFACLTLFSEIIRTTLERIAARASLAARVRGSGSVDCMDIGSAVMAVLSFESYSARELRITPDSRFANTVIHEAFLDNRIRMKTINICEKHDRIVEAVREESASSPTWRSKKPSPARRPATKPSVAAKRPAAANRPGAVTKRPGAVTKRPGAVTKRPAGRTERSQGGSSYSTHEDEVPRGGKAALPAKWVGKAPPSENSMAMESSNSDISDEEGFDEDLAQASILADLAETEDYDD